MHTHSPFHVVEEFISPATCEKIIKEFSITTPSLDEDGHPLKNERIIVEHELVHVLQDSVFEHGAEIQSRYKGLIKTIDSPRFQQYFEDPKRPCELHGCENAKFIRKKWLKTKDVDLVAYVWLKDYGSGIPLDPRFEVYGGKLEFPAYNFSLLPQRGTAVFFPAGPHFITAISPVLVGSLEQIKFSLKMEKGDGDVWLYQPSNFPGTYQDWFNQ